MQRLTNFTQYCNTLDAKSFNSNIKEIFTNSNQLINFFSYRVFIIVKNNELDSLKGTFQEIPTLILNYLSSINNYIKSCAQNLKNEQNQLMQGINNNNVVVKQESTQYLNESDFLIGTITGAFKVIQKIFNIITLKTGSMDKLLEATTRSINNLDSKIRSAPTGFDGLKDIFLSKDLGIILGGTIAAIGIFVILRRLLNKAIQFIKSKWRGLMNWSRGEDYYD